jgi:hypothetical protein
MGISKDPYKNSDKNGVEKALRLRNQNLVRFAHNWNTGILE